MAASIPVVTPEEFSSHADADDSAAMIQAAIDHVASIGGGTVRLARGKTYRLRAIAPGSALTSPDFRASLAIPPRAAGVTLDFNGATLEQMSDAFTFGSAYRLFNDRAMQATLIALSHTPRIGDTAIRLSDPARLPPGSCVMLVSGSVLPQSSTPDRNQIIACLHQLPCDMDSSLDLHHFLPNSMAQYGIGLCV